MRPLPKRQGEMTRRNRHAHVAVLAALVCLLVPAGASGRWVVRGHGFGHGVGMSQYGAYGYAKHGRGYRWILGHYFKHTHIGHTKSRSLRVLLGTAQRSIPFSGAKRACGKRLRSGKTYEFRRSGSDVLLRRRHGRRLANCGHKATARSRDHVTILGNRDYRGDLTVISSRGRMLVINDVGLEDYVRGVVANEMPSSWSPAALQVQAVAARSYGLAVRGHGRFDLYDDTRSQVYGGMDSETAHTNAAVRHTSRQIVRYRKRVATTYFSSSSGGETENVEYGFPGTSPQPYLKGVRDRFDRISPDHTWTVHYSQSRMESKLAGLFSGRLKRIKVIKRGKSPRIVTAKVVGSRGSSRIDGPSLQYQLGLKSTWARFRRK